MFAFLRSTVTFWRCAAKKYHLFVIFAVLDLRVAEVVLKRRFKMLSFFYNNPSLNSAYANLFKVGAV